MTEPVEPRLPQRFDSPRACEICFRPWDFFFDDLGRVRHRHPPKKCVAPTYAADEVSKADLAPVRKRRCVECRGEMAVTTYGSGKNRLTCGDPCRLARMARQKKEIKERDRMAEARIRELWKTVA